MKLSQIYSNKTNIFRDIKFLPGVNYILGEIKDPKNFNKDTHNLGKSTFGKILDFCLLEQKNKKTILYSNPIFSDFIFYLEVELCSNEYITICRSIDKASKISFVKNTKSRKYDISKKEDWLFYNLPFEKAKQYFNSELNYSVQNDYNFRKGIGYFLRNNNEYIDLFKLNPQSKNLDWLPYFMHLMGLDEKLYIEKENLLLEQEKYSKEENNLNNLIDYSFQDINTKLELRKQNLKKKQEEIDELNFYESDLILIRESTEEYDIKINDLNNSLYETRAYLELINKSLKKTVYKFNMEQVETIYEEVGILFPTQLKKDFNQVVSFNKSITEERTIALENEKKDLTNKCSDIEKKLYELNNKRAKALNFLSNYKFVDKFKELNNQISQLEREISELEDQKKLHLQLNELKIKIAENDLKLNEIINKLSKDENVKIDNNLFNSIQKNFNDIISSVLNKQAYIGMELNKNATYEFKEHIENIDKLNTNESEGNTYKKLLCAAFDLAILKAYIDKNFYRFVYHDGLYEGLDDRKKINLKNIVEEYSLLGIQQIITLIDSDLPSSIDKNNFIKEEEILLKLNDLGKDGLLFKMDIW